jgi:hypothetical protein
MTKSNKNTNKEKILLGLEKVYNDLIDIKRKLNRELVVIKNGKVVKIKP